MYDDEYIIENGLCTWCVGNGCKMCGGTGEHEESHEDKCTTCNGTQIETVRAQEPDGQGGYEWINEDRSCSACQ